MAPSLADDTATVSGRHRRSSGTVTRAVARVGTGARLRPKRNSKASTALFPTRAKELAMKSKVVEDADVVTYVVVCDPGDEAVSALTQFARSEDLEAAQITAVGAFEHATVGWFDRAVRDYRRIHVGQQCELLSLLGDVADGQDGPV